jgi:hydroxyacylglutathione hydrolase
MILERIVSDGLSHNSYILISGGGAAVIDPRRDCDIYISIATGHDAVITHIFETHRNEDYVIGSRELSDRCGAEIFHGSKMDFSYGKPVQEGNRFSIGDLELVVLETPGHTMESISIMVIDKAVSDVPYLVFTGDALFAGDTGRTDLFGQELRAKVSGQLHESIYTKILTAGDGAIICPAHGAGSICGSDISDHAYTTVGYEKKTNPLLQIGRDAFVDRKVREHHYIPPYFKKMEELNKNGAPLIHRLPDLKALGNNEIKDYIRKGAQVVDIRSPTSFGGAHIPGSISIWRDGLAAFIGWNLNYSDPIILVDDFNLGLEEISRIFIRMGYDNIFGYLAGGFPAWFREAEESASLDLWTVPDLKETLRDDSLFLLDVRDINNRVRYGHIRESVHIYVGELPERMQEVPRDRQVVVYCDAGYKGSLGASLLQKAGYDRVGNLLGGMGAWMKAAYPVEKDIRS